MKRSFDRYVVVGVANTLLDLAIFSALALHFGVPSLFAHVASTAIVMSISFLLNRRWVFRSDAGAASTAAPFVAVTLFSALVVQSAVITAVLASASSAAPSAAESVVIPGAKIAAMAVGMVFNYLGYRLVFDRGRWRRAESPDRAHR